MFWIVSNVGPDAVDDAPQVPIGTANDVRAVHVLLDGLVDEREAGVIHLPTEFLIKWIFSMPFACYDIVKDKEPESDKDILFGMARNAIGRTPFPCARRAGPVRFPGET